MNDDERAARMTPPPDLVRGCDSPEGVRILADWLDEHGGDGAEFRETQRDVADQPAPGEGFGRPVGPEDGSTGVGYGCGHGEAFGPGNGIGAGTADGYGFSNGDGVGYGYDYDFGYGDISGDGRGDGVDRDHRVRGTLDGDGGPDAPR